MKNKHRIKQGLSLLLAGGIALTNLGAAFCPPLRTMPPATPETAADGYTRNCTFRRTAAVVLDAGLSVEDIQCSYGSYSLPQAATGYYFDSNGLPVLTGETKIGLDAVGRRRITAPAMPDSHLIPDVTGTCAATKP